MQTSYRFSAPGRTEISGNHTDHQHGCVLAAAVDLETTAEVTLRPDSIIRVASEGYAPVEIDLNDLSGTSFPDIAGVIQKCPACKRSAEISDANALFPQLPQQLWRQAPQCVCFFYPRCPAFAERIARAADLDQLLQIGRLRFAKLPDRKDQILRCHLCG